jgi:hypothetical protein
MLTAALLGLRERLEGAEVRWLVGGSTAAMLHGMPVEPRDVDVLTDAGGAYAIETRFPECVRRPVAFSSNGSVRSHLGVLDLGGVRVEIMGDLQVLAADGAWGAPFPRPGDETVVELDGVALPVATLAATRRLNAELGR